jgi:Synergist-CTERM protein sorting domain-containing protein
MGLAKQIAEEVDCESPSSLAPLAQTARLRFTSNAVMPYFHPAAKTSLVAAANAASLQVNSGYRTVAQQYLLYRWWQQGRCGITAAATPGRSNHESGRAVDLANWSSRIGTMSAHGWSHDVPGDPVHFDHLSSPDARGRDVRAFQTLWNRNHPNDKISVDGVYGPQTGARLAQSPATGFAKGSTCGAVKRAVDVLAIDGPDYLAPQAPTHYAYTIANNDTVDWPASARIVVADGTPSELYDPTSWVSATEVGTLAAAIPAGGQGIIDIDVVAPAAETAAGTTFAIVDGDRVIDTFDLSVAVVHGATPEQSSDASDDPNEIDPTADENGASSGCAAGGGAGWLALALPLVVLRRRRR